MFITLRKIARNVMIIFHLIDLSTVRAMITSVVFTVIFLVYSMGT